jgi:hypothetical protein
MRAIQQLIKKFKDSANITKLLQKNIRLNSFYRQFNTI